MRTAFVIAALLACSLVNADTTIVTTTVTVTSAQQEAETMARTGLLRHCGRNAGRPEGIGFSPASAEAAIKNCCYWGSRKPREIGVARGPRGWFACVRYW